MPGTELDQLIFKTRLSRDETKFIKVRTNDNVMMILAALLLTWTTGICASNETYTDEACEHSDIPLTIDCGEEVIQIQHAVYGVHSNDNSCNATSYQGECAADTSLQASFNVNVMRKKCDGKRNCEVLAEITIFGDPCVGVEKYLTCSWRCSVKGCLVLKVDNGTVSPSGAVTHGTVVTVTCQRKHLLFGDKFVTCQYAEWSHQPKCRMCDRKNNVMMIWVVLLLTSSTRICASDEKYTGEACEHSDIPLTIDCGEGVIQIEHAVYGVHSNDNSCNATYSEECAANTSLQASFNIRCPELEVNNAKVSPNGTVTRGTVVTVTCKPKHLLIGDKYVTCQSTKWSTVPKCRKCESSTI
ncbi:hypothetical protein ACHWQZ_G016933 [Mnemiopsis leidyi]